MIKGFRDFILRGNVIDLAVAVVIGAAFGAVVTALTTNVLQPLINAIGSPDTGALGFTIRRNVPSTFVDLGAVISAGINFLAVAAVVYFLVVTPMNRLMALRRRDEIPATPSPAEDVVLLTQIRDLLQQQAPRG